MFRIEGLRFRVDSLGLRAYSQGLGLKVEGEGGSTRLRVTTMTRRFLESIFETSLGITPGSYEFGVSFHIILY